jgi:hypothetical protein
VKALTGTPNGTQVLLAGGSYPALSAQFNVGDGDSSGPSGNNVTFAPAPGAASRPVVRFTHGGVIFLAGTNDIVEGIDFTADASTTSAPIHGNDGVLMDQVKITSAGPQAFQGGIGPGGATIRDSLIQATGSAVSSAPGAGASSSITLRSDTVIGGGAGGVALDLQPTADGSSTVTVVNSILAGTQADIRSVSGAGTSASVTTINSDYSTTTPGLVSGVSLHETAPQHGPPAFVNPAGGDYREAAASTATIDHGQAIPAQTPPETTDLAGNPRTVGGTPDIGAYEFVPPVPTPTPTPKPKPKPVGAPHQLVDCSVSSALKCKGKGGTVTCSIAAASRAQRAGAACSGVAKDIQCGARRGSKPGILCSGNTAAVSFTCVPRGAAKVISQSAATGAKLSCSSKDPKVLVCGPRSSNSPQTCKFDAGPALTQVTIDLAALVSNSLRKHLSPLRIDATELKVRMDGTALLPAFCPNGVRHGCAGTMLLVSGGIIAASSFTVPAGRHPGVLLKVGELVRTALKNDNRGRSLGVTTSIFALALEGKYSASRAAALLHREATRTGAITEQGLTASFLIADGFTELAVKPQAPAGQSVATGGWNRVTNVSSLQPVTIR